MIHKQKINIPSSTKIIEHIIAKCVKCGCDDIKIEEYEDTFGYISTATCKNKNCDNIIKDTVSESGIIERWNAKNDISLLIESKKTLILKTKEEIKQLQGLQKNRNKKVKNT